MNYTVFLFLLIGSIKKTEMNAEQAAFMEKIYLEYNSYLYKQIRLKMESNPFQVNDLVQDCFVRLIENVSTLMTLDTQQLVKYIYATAQSTLADYWRKNAHTETVPLEDFELEDTNINTLPDNFLQIKEDTAIFYQALQAIPQKERLLILARYAEDKSCKEIAAELHKSPEATRSALSRAKKHIQENINKLKGEEKK